MLTPLLHRKRKLAKRGQLKARSARCGDAVEQTRQIYGTRLLVRGLLWISMFFLSRGLLELGDRIAGRARVAIALLPTPFFVWYLWTWMKGVSRDGRTPAAHRARSARLRVSRRRSSS